MATKGEINMKVEYIVMENTYDNALFVERMRYKSYGIKKDIEPLETDYVEEIENGSILVFLCLVDNIPVSACYISDFRSNLYVDYLFTLPDYQRKQLYYGKRLLQYILEHKQIVEKYFHHQFNKSTLCPGSNNVIELYKSLGYKPINKSDIQMSKNI